MIRTKKGGLNSKQVFVSNGLKSGNLLYNMEMKKEWWF